MKKGLAAVVIIVLAVGGFLAARSLRRQFSLRVANAPATAGPAPTVKFVKTPVALPDLTFKTLDGRVIKSSEWKGKVTLVNFWATWCPPCREEIPDLIKLQAKYKDQLQIIGVSSDELPVAEVAKFAAEHKMNYVIAMETPELRKAFPGIFALPTTFVIDQDVRMVQKHVGRLDIAVTEQETRVLAKLEPDAKVELVDDNGQGLLSNAAATDVPGLGLETLTPVQRTAALKRLNDDLCTCGCGLTLAQCRINDPSCTTSLPIAKKLVEDVKKP